MKQVLGTKSNLMLLVKLPSCLPAITNLVLQGKVLERLKCVTPSFSYFLHALARIFLQCSLRGVGKSYFKHTSVFALLWSPSDGIACSPSPHMKWEMQLSWVTKEGTDTFPLSILPWPLPLLPCSHLLVVFYVFLAEARTRLLSGTRVMLMANSLSPE